MACQTFRKVEKIEDNGIIDVTILQLNDVYEIAPLEGGKIGGMARVATIRKQLLKENPNTLTVMAGDFYNPSVTGTLAYQGKKIRGAQMIETMNAVGFDLAVFGNHEFDLDYPDFQARINESKFKYMSGNCKWKIGDKAVPFIQQINDTTQQNIPASHIWSVKDADGTMIKIGFFSSTVPSNPKPYVHYDDWMESAKQDVEQLIPVTDIVLGITHLNKAEDLQLAAMLPTVPLIIGGHDHENMKERVGNVVLTKADANAKTAYIHRIQYNKLSKVTTLKSELVAIDAAIPFDSLTNEIVEKWGLITKNSLKSQGIDAKEVITTLKEPLNGTSASIRNQQNNLGTVLCNSMLAAVKQPADAAFFNSGAVRLDDYLTGIVTQYDIVRLLPYGGNFVEVEMKGSLLKQILEIGVTNKLSGGYLQWANIQHKEKNNIFTINNQPIIIDKIYRIVTTDFLLTGLEKGFPFLLPNHPDIMKMDAVKKDDVTDRSRDIRGALVAYMRKM